MVRVIKPGTPNVLTADGLLTLNKDGNDWPSIEVEIITWDVTYDGQYCFDQRGPGELHVSGNLEPGTNYDFVVNQPITFSFSEQVYKVCVSPNWRESFELEPVNGNYSYTPTEDRALRFEVFMTQDDYEFEQFRPNHDAGEFSVNYGLGVDDDVFVGNNPVITYGNVIPEASMTLRNQTRLFGKSGGKYMVGCEGITPAEMDCVIDATIYDGDKAISQTLQYSIESYVASRIEESTSTTYKNLMRLMILYGQAAKKHFG